MEATALSVGKAVLDTALDYAKSFIKEEIALQLGVEEDVAFITDELEMMQAFLMAADEEQDKHKLLLTWVKQVRESAYNVEDSLMDVSAHYDKRPSCWWCVPRAVWERRDIAKEMKALRTRVEDVSSRNLRYRLIKGSGGSNATTNLDEQANVASVAAMFGVNEDRRAAAEQENPKVHLFHLITSDDTDLRTVAVWGSGGDLGKTSLIREAYEHRMVYKKFGCRAWVMLTSPFNPSEFFKSLLRQFNVYSREVAGKTLQAEVSGYDVLREFEKMKESHVPEQVLVCLEEKRYLIVIDGLTNIVEWDWIKTYFPDKKNGSRIIVSTQQVEVASLCQQPYQVTEVKQLSSDHSIYLFHNKVVLRSVNDSAMLSSSSGTHEETQQQMAVGGDESLERRKLSRSKTTVAFAENFVGRMNEKDDIMKLIGQDDDTADDTSRPSSSKVISVWGMGGLGKTTLVRSVYESQRLGSWKRAWVTALRPFNSEVILRDLVLQLQEYIQQDPDPAAAIQAIKGKEAIKAMGYQQLIAKLKCLVTEKCLIVVDDLSSTEEWDSIKEGFKKAGCVIVTTRERTVATDCSTETKHLYSLQRLDDTAAFDLFQQKVFKDKSEKVDLCPDMVEQARLILKKCDGLPLAISTIGGFLASKPKTAIEWRKINERINVELDISLELRTIKKVLVRSYDGLPYHLKACFLYLSIFPEDHKIRRKPLIRRWVAEGFVREVPGMTAEEVGDKYFEELLDRSMILPGEEENMFSGIGSCQLHDNMWQICTSKAREENLSLTMEGESGLSSTTTTTTTAQHVVRHLAISSSWKRDKDVFNRILDVSHVRSLTVFGYHRSYFISKKMRFLRVLDLEGTKEIKDHHLNQIGELIHLKYISMRGCRGINNLPNSLGNLRNLQTLDVRDTGVRRLPSCITNLQKLRFIRTNSCGAFVPIGIGKLNALCTLAHVKLLYGEGKDTLEELSQLYQLHKLCIENISTRIKKEFWSAIARLKHLLSLSANWGATDQLELDSFLGENLLPPRSIETLKLGSRVVKLTEWIHHLQNLSRLHLLWTELKQDAIEAVGKLPNLAILVMSRRSFKEKELVFKQLGQPFPSLLQLDLDIGDPLVSVKFEDGAMPELELLRIHGWRELQELSGLRNLTNLKKIRLKGFANCKQFMDNVEEQLQVAVVGNPNNKIRILMLEDQDSGKTRAKVIADLRSKIEAAKIEAGKDTKRHHNPYCHLHSDDEELEEKD